MRFFMPYVGSKYKDGVNGKKILVLGASFYCNQTECQYFKSCTDNKKKDSSPYDKTCPIYAESGKMLSLEPSYCIEVAPETYKKFASGMKMFTGTDDYEHIWEHLAFTNYVQHFLRAPRNRSRNTLKTDISPRDFDAFIETVKELQPDIVIAWGCVINSFIRENCPHYIADGELSVNEEYLWHIEVPGVGHKITVVNPFHPSSRKWKSTLHLFQKYLTKALDE